MCGLTFRGKLAPTAGRQAPDGKNVHRTAGRGLVARRWVLSLTEGLGRQRAGLTHVAALNSLGLGLLELNNVAFRIPAIQDNMTSKPPRCRLWFEIATSGFNRLAHSCEVVDDECWLERRLVSWLRWLGNVDSRCVHPRDSVHDYLVSVATQEIVCGVRFFNGKFECCLVKGRHLLLVFHKDYEALLLHFLLSYENRWEGRGDLCFCRLTFELSWRQRRDARPRPQTMCRAPVAWAWWPAVGAPLEQGVRRRSAHGEASVHGT